MHRIAFPKNLIFCLIFAVFAPAMLPAQKAASGEVVLTKCWQADVDTTGGGRIGTDGARIYISSAGAKIDALSMDGKKHWSAELGGQVNSDLLASDAGIFVVTAPVTNSSSGNGENVLRGLSKETGVTNWTIKLPNASEHFLRMSRGEIIVVSKSGVVLSVNAKDGSVKWRREIAEGFTAKPAFSVSKVLVATASKQLFVISLTNGEIESVKKPETIVTALGQPVNGGLIIGDERGGVAYFESNGAKADWRFRSGGSVSSIFAVNGSVLFTSNDNFAYLLSSGGGAKWKRRLSGRAAWIATYGEKFAMIAGIDDHAIVLVDLSNGKVAGQIALGGNESLIHDAIAAGDTIFILTDLAAYAYSLSSCSK